jgi:hypothetical protein
VWLFGFLAVDYRLPLHNAKVALQFQTAPFVIAIAGGLGGLLGGLLVALPYPASDKSPRVLILGGVATGALGGGFALPAVVLCGEWLSPLASSTLFWCLVGFLAGLGAHRLSAATVRRTESGDKSSEEVIHPNEWVRVRLLPLLAVVGFLFYVYLVMAATRY